MRKKVTHNQKWGETSLSLLIFAVTAMLVQSMGGRAAPSMWWSQQKPPGTDTTLLILEARWWGALVSHGKVQLQEAMPSWFALKAFIRDLSFMCKQKTQIFQQYFKTQGQLQGILLIWHYKHQTDIRLHYKQGLGVFLNFTQLPPPSPQQTSRDAHNT